jgi:hypothetical protein
VANGLFTQMFENAQVENIITTASGHFAVLLSLEKVATKLETFKYNFKYEAAWCRAADYNDVVGKLWAEGMKEQMNTHTTWNKLKGMANGLTAWSNKSFGSPRREIRKLEKRLVWLRSSSATRSYSHEEKEIECKLCELFEREEIMTRQRSRVEWLQVGDSNTSFFSI